MADPPRRVAGTVHPSTSLGTGSPQRNARIPVLVWCLWTVVCGLWTSGCVRRSLTIRTEPPGALVYVNDVLKGASPLTYDFEWYGWHRLTIRKEGFERLEDRKLLRAPIYFWIPLDLAFELLPLPIPDRRTWSYALTPVSVPPAPTPPPLTAAEPTEESQP